MAGLSVIIPTRDEDLLVSTVRAVKASRLDPSLRLEFVLVNDGGQAQLEATALPGEQDPTVSMRFLGWRAPVGLGQARDCGLMAAEHDACLVLDAHMDLEHGAPDRIVRLIEEHPTWVGHGACWSINRDKWAPGLGIPAQVELNGAGELVPTAAGWDQPARLGINWRVLQTETCGRHVAFAPGWIDARSTAEYRRRQTALVARQCLPVPGVYGASYCMDRRHYAGLLRRPWQKLLGWGSSEANLSLINWFLGGENCLYPFHAAHWFKGPRGGFRIPGEHVAHNFWRIAWVLPVPDVVRASWMEHLRDDPYRWAVGTMSGMQERIEALVRGQGADEYRDYLAAKAVRTWAEWESLWKAPDESSYLPGT